MIWRSADSISGLPSNVLILLAFAQTTELLDAEKKKNIISSWRLWIFKSKANYQTLLLKVFKSIMNLFSFLLMIMPVNYHDNFFPNRF